jgi:stage V sporulation protein AE
VSRLKNVTYHRKRRVIVVTDGDHMAKRALKMVAKQTECTVIIQSAGNPTRLTGERLVEFIQEAPFDPVIVMLDDNGDAHQSDGELALATLLTHPGIQVIGALAVASNTLATAGITVDFSFDCEGRRVESGVNKDGIAIDEYVVHGDTVDILRKHATPLIIGIGDIGKMAGHDSPERGSPITTKAIKYILSQEPIYANSFIPPTNQRNSEHRVT